MNTTLKHKRPLLMVLSIGVLLLIPLGFMLFTDQVQWSFLDFVIMAVLLGILGFMIELTLRYVNQPKMKIVLSLIIIAIVLLIWLELAVGIFGSPIAGN